MVQPDLVHGWAKIYRFNLVSPSLLIHQLACLRTTWTSDPSSVVSFPITNLSFHLYPHVVEAAMTNEDAHDLLDNNSSIGHKGNENEDNFEEILVKKKAPSPIH